MKGIWGGDGSPFVARTRKNGGEQRMGCEGREGRTAVLFETANIFLAFPIAAVLLKEGKF